MIILAHRGYWLDPSEKNSETAFRRAFEKGFGCEMDIRDQAGSLVVSHDPPQSACMTFSEFLKLHAEIDPQLCLAVNVKADGLQTWFRQCRDEWRLRNFYVFDMAVPDALSYVRHGVPAYTRLSEYERTPSFLEQSAGIWLDAFHGDWWTDHLAEIRAFGKPLVLVSPELHGRDHANAWSAWRDFAKSNPSISLAICTDLPEQAKDFFDV
jgi:hypothetical protein